jgi:DNA-3-methyladenine glycosylase II
MDARVKPAHDAKESPAMTEHLDSQADLDDAIRALVRLDPRLQQVLDVAGTPSLRRREPGFTGLAHIVTGQQLSTASAGAIWGRLQVAFDPFDAEAVRRARADRLGRLGLSAAKIKTLKHIARELAAERLNLDVLANEDADAAHNTLTALPGIGPWTADVYLLFCLGHGDAWPAGDVAIQEAIKVGLGLAARPNAKQMMPIAECWRPLRGAAAHLWWTYYRAIKKREGVLGAEATAAKANDVSNNVVVAKPSSSRGKIAARSSPGPARIRPKSAKTSPRSKS